MYPFCIGVLPVGLKPRMQVPEALGNVSVIAGLVTDVGNIPMLTPALVVAGRLAYTCKGAVGAVVPMPRQPVLVRVI